MPANKMISIGYMGLIAWVFMTAYLWWQYHTTHNEDFRPIVFFSMCGCAAWTLGLIIWRAVSEQEKKT